MSEQEIQQLIRTYERKRLHYYKTGDFIPNPEEFFAEKQSWYNVEGLLDEYYLTYSAECYADVERKLIKAGEPYTAETVEEITQYILAKAWPSIFSVYIPARIFRRNPHYAKYLS